MSVLSDINYGWPNTCPELQTLMEKNDAHEPWAILHSKAVACNRISDANWKPLIEKINTVANHGPLIIDCSSDPFNGHEETLIEFLSGRIDRFLILSEDIRYLDSPKDHICYFPYFFLVARSLKKFDSNIVNNHSRQYLISCMNHTPKVHRIENWVKIRRQSWYDRSMTSMYSGYDEKAFPYHSDAVFSSPSIPEEYKNAVGLLPRDHNNIPTIGIPMSHPAYIDSYINLTTESSVSGPQIFFSEKSFKPFLGGQIGLWLADPGTVSWLRRLGFDMFDDLIDHAYDSITDWRVRIDMIHDQINQLASLNMADIFYQTRDRRLANQELVFDQSLYDQVTAQCNFYKDFS
jgi:hypothetical protein